MLVLSRQRDESIVINHNIEVVIVDIRGDKVRLGINAPEEITVHRREVEEAVLREGQVKSHAHHDTDKLSQFKGRMRAALSELSTQRHSISEENRPIIDRILSRLEQAVAA